MCEMVDPYALSHPSRGAWIEMLDNSPRMIAFTTRTPHGVRGLKCLLAHFIHNGEARTPHGVRGLKSSGIFYALM